MTLLLDDNNVVVGYGTFSEESSELQEVLTRIVRGRIDKDDYDLYDDRDRCAFPAGGGRRLWYRTGPGR